MGFSEHQQQAIMHDTGPAMVLAGPGSGKTTVITQRIKYLIENRHIDPQHILVITFTRAAAQEMEGRFQKLCASPQPVNFGTFHSIFFQILKLNFKYTSKNIISEREQMLTLRGYAEALKVDMEYDADFFRQLLSEIAECKAREAAGSKDSFQSELLDPEVFQQLFRGYRQSLRERRLIDFDDMLFETLQLFRTRPRELQVWQEKFRYILVDEFQDASPIQYEIVRLLAEPRRNLFIVGDDDQSIYGFRGARPELMLHFEKDYPGAKRILLSDNYRSHSEVVEIASRIIGHNKARFPKKITAPKGKGGCCRQYRVKDTHEEYLLLAESLRLAIRKGADPSRLAVLYRTNSMVRPLLPELMKRDIPFVLKEKVPNLYDHFIAEDILAYLRLAEGSGSRGDLLRIMNRPLRYLSRNAVQGTMIRFQDLERYYRSRGDMLYRLRELKRDLNVLRHLPTQAAILYLRKRVGYEDWLRDYARENHTDFESFRAILEEITEAGAAYPERAAYFHFVEDYSAQLQAKMKDEKKTEKGVALMTYHGAKGLEFDAVHLIDCVEGVTPYRKAQSEAQIEEERREFYVAVTRARAEVHIYVTEKRYSKACTISRFALEAMHKRSR